ncbi:kinase domain-containing [Cryptosporidium sp. chipmunk genotype I]|uniref:kinase domain-containing n=1 Tax=Cryptosporidium sp. chipmunk genotype I TaxID=1280935 RepID=UPI00351A38BA|nr:kinase domain-containing [Cryptosporidium sp. chipmunk genotype I]
MNIENRNESNLDLGSDQIDRISAHEQVLATRYLSRYKSFYGRLHSPSNNGLQLKRGVFIYLDEQKQAIGNQNLGIALYKNTENEHKILDSIVKLKEKLFKIKENISTSIDYDCMERNRKSIEEIMEKCNEISLMKERLKNNEQNLTRKLALIKNSFKTSVIQFKKIERELNRNQLFWQESQVGLAPAVNGNILKKRRQVILEEQEKSDNYKRKSQDNMLERAQDSSENQEFDANSYIKGSILSRSMTLSKRTSINSMNNSCYTLKELQKSEIEESQITSSEIAHYNTLASNNPDNNNNIGNNHHSSQINLGYIDDEIYRDGLNFQNLINLKNRLQGYLNQTPYQILNGIEMIGKKQGSEIEKIANSILNKRQDYLLDFTKRLELSGMNLDIERSLYVKKSRLFRHQQNSRYNNLSTLSDSQTYTLLNMIGKGGFAEVWEVLNMNTWSITAAKIHELTPDMTEHERMVCVERVSNEIKLHRDLKHPNIVNMLHCFEVDNDRLVTIMELCDGPDLDTFIKTNGNVPEELAIIWIRQILEGILYLNNLDKNGDRIIPNRNPIIHYDLKPGNIILHRGCCKIADFGLSKQSDQESGNIIIERIGGGTVWYQPPEILLRPGDSLDNPRVVSHKVDIWAIGCIFFEILHLRRPFGLRSNSIAEAFSLIPLEAEKGAIFESHVSSECKSYINWLLTYDPVNRPSIFEAFSHPLIQNVASI